MKSMKLSQYFEVTKPTYVTLRLRPHKSVRNYNSSTIAKAMADMLNQISCRITKVEKKFVVKTELKCTYFIDIRKDDVTFNFIVPTQYENIARERIREVWTQCTIEKVDKIDLFSEKAIAYQLSYAKEDALSLDVNKSSNAALNNILNVIDYMEDQDRIGVFYNFSRSNTRQFKYQYEKTMQKIKAGYIVDKELTIMTVLKQAANLVDNLFGIVFEILFDLVGASKEDKKETMSYLDSMLLFDRVKPTEQTRKKKDIPILTTNIAVFSDSEDDKRRKDNAEMVAGAFNVIDGDNQLKKKKIKNKKIKVDPENLYITGIKENQVSIDECANFLQLPGKTILENYKINHINTLETKIKEELLTGYLRLGKQVYKGQETEAYLSADKNIGNMSLAILGPMSAGKTTYLSNYSIDAYRRGEGGVCLDFVKHCELAQAIEKVIPKDKLIVIDLSNYEEHQAFGYNEILNKPVKDVEDLLDRANMQTKALISFIDAINPSVPLTVRMKRCLTAAGNITFLEPGKSLRDVIDVLQDHLVRAAAISRIPEELKPKLKVDIYNLKDMDQYGTSKDNKYKVVGTMDSKLDYVMDRLNSLMDDMKLRNMLEKPIDQNIDFCKAMDEGKFILVKIPEDVFTDDEQKNILVTFYLTKIWLCAKLRGGLYKEPKRTHIILDEIFHADTACKFIKEKLYQSRKFQMKFIFTMHDLEQAPDISKPLKEGGGSFMLLQGTDKKNFKALENELAPHEIDDLLNLKQFHSLNLIKCKEGYSSFITKLPPPPVEEVAAAPEEIIEAEIIEPGPDPEIEIEKVIDINLEVTDSGEKEAAAEEVKEAEEVVFMFADMGSDPIEVEPPEAKEQIKEAAEVVKDLEEKKEPPAAPKKRRQPAKRTTKTTKKKDQE